MKIVYSFNKKGREAAYWTEEIRNASSEEAQFVPFNHDPYLPIDRYIRAQLLDNLYYERNSHLLRMYDDMERVLSRTRADVLLVDNCPPYHPEFLRRLDVYKVLRIADGPITAYDRDFAYLHAYDHVLYHSPAYSADLGMAEKLEYCRVRRADFWPLALFDAAFDPRRSLDQLLAQPRDIEVVFVGAIHAGKMSDLARVKKYFGRRIRMYGLVSLKRNAYFNVKYGFPGWIRPLPADQYVSLYQRAKVGLNLHNRGKYTVGNYRMFELPGNGVLQISDGDEYLRKFFVPGSEIVGYSNIEQCIEQAENYLVRDNDRGELVAAAYKAVLDRHRFRHRIVQAVRLISSGMAGGLEDGPGERHAGCRRT